MTGGRTATPARRVVVTADDFGAAPAVNEAVERAHVEGILTAASLMVGGAACDDAVARARRLPALGVGLHVVLCDGVPVLPPARVSWLVSADGRFRESMLATALLVAFVPAARAQMRAEVAAQFAAFAATGLALDHANAHKHFHLHPVIAAAIRDAGRRHGLNAMRMPREPGGGVLAWWAGVLGRGWRRQGLLVNDTVFGLAASGHFDAAAMAAAIAALPDGLSEIYAHPATGDYPGSAPGYRYGDELAALLDPGVCAALSASGAVTGRFADFTGVR
ncbi:MAG: hopanoid biosynthesis-associated protein HpnK [Sphingomonadales bacterium]|nr:hopanoid biosynthesis-associated protein HpnK [Sphingomonadales bacterium]